MNRSRLKRRLEKQTKNSLIISLIGIVFVFFILIKFGLPLLINFTLFVSGFKNTNESQNKTSSPAFIPSPQLDSLPNATNSAQTIISGNASSKQTINLYINDELIKKTKTKDDGSFVFEDIKLSRGENSITAKALTEDKKESDFSAPIVISFKDKPPSLSVESPSEKQSFSKDENNIKVSGKTDKGTRVTVNDFWAIVDENGNFSYQLPLQNGENTIKIVATDDAGNKTETERKVIYSP